MRRFDPSPLVLAFLVTLSCARPGVSADDAARIAEEAARKRADDRECLRARTCEEYAACRARVAAKYGVPFTGRCEP
jgi:hypothetical protein